MATILGFFLPTTSYCDVLLSLHSAYFGQSPHFFGIPTPLHHNFGKLTTFALVRMSLHLEATLCDFLAPVFNSRIGMGSNCLQLEGKGFQSFLKGTSKRDFLLMSS